MPRALDVNTFMRVFRNAATTSVVDVEQRYSRRSDRVASLFVRIRRYGTLPPPATINFPVLIRHKNYYRFFFLKKLPNLSACS